MDIGFEGFDGAHELYLRQSKVGFDDCPKTDKILSSLRKFENSNLR